MLSDAHFDLLASIQEGRDTLRDLDREAVRAAHSAGHVEVMKPLPPDWQRPPDLPDGDVSKIERRLYQRIDFGDATPECRASLTLQGRETYDLHLWNARRVAEDRAAAAASSKPREWWPEDVPGEDATDWLVVKQAAGQIHPETDQRDAARQMRSGRNHGLKDGGGMFGVAKHDGRYTLRWRRFGTTVRSHDIRYVAADVLAVAAIATR